MTMLQKGVFEEVKGFFKNKSLKILLFLLAVDIVLLCIHFVHKYYVFGSNGSTMPLFHLISNPIFSITQDRSIGEYFQYFKEITICLLLLVMAIRNKSFLGWSILFLYFFADDMFSIHEILGLRISKSLSFPSLFGLRPEDLGELTVSAIAGVIIFGLIAYGYLNDKKIANRSKIILLFAMVLFLVVFGVGIDMFDVLFNNFIVKGLLSAFEDFGEMIIMSIIVWKTNFWQSLHTIEISHESFPIPKKQVE